MVAGTSVVSVAAVAFGTVVVHVVAGGLGDWSAGRVVDDALVCLAVDLSLLYAGSEDHIADRSFAVAAHIHSLVEEHAVCGLGSHFDVPRRTAVISAASHVLCPRIRYTAHTVGRNLDHTVVPAVHSNRCTDLDSRSHSAAAFVAAARSMLDSELDSADSDRMPCLRGCRLTLMGRDFPAELQIIAKQQWYGRGVGQANDKHFL